MNAAKRKRIRAVIKELLSKMIDWDFVENEISDLLSEEEDTLDNMSEAFSETERYAIAEESAGYLEEALDYVDPDDAEAAQAIIKTLKQIDGV